jgi:hypothetical protein
MKAESLHHFYNKVFCVNELAQYFKEPPASVKMQVHRLCKKGVLVRLKKNSYTFTHFHPDIPLIGQEMVKPSYHSLEWVLAQKGIIPEGVSVYTLITSKKTQRYENTFGNFFYRRLSPDLFFGIDRLPDGTLTAMPEKALLDYLFLDSARFTPDFSVWKSERFDELDKLNWKWMEEKAPLYNMKKLTVLLDSLKKYAFSEEYQEHL